MKLETRFSTPSGGDLGKVFLLLTCPHKPERVVPGPMCNSELTQEAGFLYPASEPEGDNDERHGDFPVSTIRSFIAVQLSHHALTELTRLQEHLKEILPPKAVRWTSPNNVHLTLHFLGDVAEHRIEDVSRTVHNVSATHPPFSLNLSNLSCFPNTRRPRIVWVGLSGETDILVALQRNLGESLKQAIGFQPESRKYSPHLTIGRVKKGVTKQRLAELGRSLEQEIPGVGHLASLPVDHIHFIRTDLRPDGPIYTSLSKGQLGQTS